MATISMFQEDGSEIFKHRLWPSFDSVAAAPWPFNFIQVSNFQGWWRVLKEPGGTNAIMDLELKEENGQIIDVYSVYSFCCGMKFRLNWLMQEQLKEFGPEMEDSSTRIFPKLTRVTICKFESSARPSFRVFAGTDIWSEAAKPWMKNHEAPLPSRSAELQCVPWLLARKKQCLHMFCGCLYLSQLGAFVGFSGKSKVSGSLGWHGHADAYRWGGLHAEVDSCGTTAGWSCKDRVGKPQYEDVKNAPVRLPVWEDDQRSKVEFEAKE